MWQPQPVCCACLDAALGPEGTGPCSSSLPYFHLTFLTSFLSLSPILAAFCCCPVLSLGAVLSEVTHPAVAFATEISSLSLVYEEEESKEDSSVPSTSLEKPPQKLLPFANGVEITALDFGELRVLLARFHLRSFLVGSQLSLPDIPDP